MADVRKIITEEDPLLRQEAVEVKRFNPVLHKLLDDMKETMYEVGGVGLAAPQIGISKRILVMDDREEEGYCEMVNPLIISAQGTEEGVEYCLSVLGRGGKVIRATDITIQAQDRFGQLFTLNTQGYRARVFQHEIDHLHGRLFLDIMTEEVRDDE